MSLFDSPNDMQWQEQIHGFKRSSNETYQAIVLDERGDGNYLDNMFQKYTVELLGWRQVLSNVKVRIPNAGYNGTGTHVSFKKGDGVLIQCKEGQLDEAFIIGAQRLNGDIDKLEVQGQAEKYGEHPKGAGGRTAAAAPVSLHPGRVTKIDGEVHIGGVNNVQTPYEDPTENGTLEESLNKQPLPGVFKACTKEGVDINYTYGGMVRMTDGNYVVLSSGTTQNKCTKYLEQASRHNKISQHLRNLVVNIFGDTFGLAVDAALKDVEDTILPIRTQEQTPLVSTPTQSEAADTLSTTETTLIKSPITGAPVNSTPDDQKTSDENKQRGLSENTPIIPSDEQIQKESYGIKAGTNVYRSLKHQQLSLIAAAQAEECNSNNAAFQYSALILGNNTVPQITSPEATTSTPGQGLGHVDPNNYSSRNTANPKPPTEFVGCHPNNFSTETHTLKYLVMHHSVASMKGTIDTFQDPKRKASAHYAVGRDGRVVQFVQDNQKAYHVRGQNTGKIGIEIIATKPNEGMTTAQEEALIKLSRYLISTYKIPVENVRGHNTFMDTECPTWIFPTQDILKEWANKYLKV
jgi:hypothetical protein